MNDLKLFINFLKTGRTGRISSDLLINQAYTFFGIPDGKDVYDNFVSPVDGTPTTLTNLYYPGLYLVFLEQSLFQFNIELQQHLQIDELLKLDCFSWYNIIRSMSVSTLLALLQKNQVSFQQLTNPAFDEGELVLFIEESKLRICTFDLNMPQIYKITYINLPVERGNSRLQQL